MGLFKKYFLIFLGLICGSAIIFSSVFLILASKYFEKDKYRLLCDNAINAKNVFVNNYYENMRMYINKKHIMSAYNVISNSINANIFLTDVDGNIEIYKNMDGYNQNTSVQKKVIEDIIKNGVYKCHGNLNGFYKKPHYIVAMPIIVDKNIVMGVIFITAPSQNVEKLLLDISKIFTISFIIVMLVSMGIIWLVTRKMVLPLKQMAEKTKIFAKGDFRQKIEIYKDDEIGQLSQSLNEMAESLEKIEEKRRYFIASVSHELKTPMTTILSFTQGIIDGIIPSEKQDEYLEIILKEVKRLSKVITSMTSLTKIDSGQVTLTKTNVNISELARQIIFNFEQEIAKKDIKIYGIDDNDIFAFCDKDMIYQVIYNLVENAVKFTNTSGYIKIRYKDAGDIIYIGIKNSGKGIKNEDLKYIFDKFYKVDKSRNLDKNSVGLGLYIVKEILKLHESSIEVESRYGEYTEFFFWLSK